jgi:hypothetical protein
MFGGRDGSEPVLGVYRKTASVLVAEIIGG